MIRSTFGGLSTALSALQANQKRLDITSQNLANMNTVGYTRQQLEVNSLGYTGNASFYSSSNSVVSGFGVGMKCVSQIRDPYLDIQYRNQMGKASYNDAMQDSLDSLSSILDETNISGIRSALDDIQSSLTGMQSIDTVEDPIYEAELRSRMNTLCDLLNDAARQIESAEKVEYTKLSGEGSSEQGAVETINDLLKQIGELNTTIKRCEVMGQSSLELIDERNVLLDELSSYIPIEVSYTKDAGRENNKDWPEDLVVSMSYVDSNGNTQKLTLVNGTTKNDNGLNYGSVEVNGNANSPLNTTLTFTAADTTFTTVNGNTTADKTIEIGADNGKGSAYLSSGSVQASLDMLGRNKNTSINSYDTYMDKLNTLASEFAKIINGCNKTDKGQDDLLTITDTTNAAKTISINSDWSDGKIGISTFGESKNEVIISMLKAMKTSQKDLENKTFADYMNNVSTILANTSSKNSTSLTNNVTVLNSIQDSKDSMSGVSMDEEATNMITYLSAYNAASRILTAMDEALETLINGTGKVGR